MRRLLLAPLAVAVLATGCSTFEPDVVARVDGDELTRDELDELAGLLRPGAEGDADTLREMINVWIVGQSIDAALDEDGVEIGDDAVQAATNQLEQSGVLEGTGDDLREQFIRWQVGFNHALGEGGDFGSEAVARRDTWVKPRYGQLVEGAVTPLALSTVVGV